jgi:hypothetical protein
MTLPNFPLFDEIAIAQNSDTKAIVQQQQDQGQNPVVGGSLVVGVLGGGAALWAGVSKFLEKYGNTAIDSKQKEVNQKFEQQKQELEQQKEIAQFFIEEARRDSGTINEALAEANKAIHKTSDIFVTKHLDTSKQYMDLYYDLVEQMKISNQEAARKNELLEAIAQNQKDILAVLNMKYRQSGQ